MRRESEDEMGETKRAAHTPGPWTVQNETVVMAGHSYRGQVADAVVTGAMTHGEVRANAALIAAAPDLLGAVKNLLATHSGGAKTCGHEFTCVCPFDAARAAIAKAEARHG